jgi:AraC-like DNA-binding protein
VGLSSWSDSVYALERLVEEAKCAANDRFLHTDAHLFRYHAASLFQPDREGTGQTLSPSESEALQACALSLDGPRLQGYIQTILQEPETGQMFVMKAVAVNNQLMEIFNALSPNYIVKGRYRSLSKNVPPMPEDFDTTLDAIAAINAWAATSVQHIIAQQGAVRFPAILAAKYYIENHFMHDISLEEIASYVHLQPAYFSTKFHAQTGKRFSAYLRDYRLEQALSLLQSSNMRLSTLASAVGFQNTSYFSKEFSKKYHMTPTQYRQHYFSNHQGKDDET